MRHFTGMKRQQNNHVLEQSIKRVYKNFANTKKLPETYIFCLQTYHEQTA